MERQSRSSQEGKEHRHSREAEARPESETIRNLRSVLRRKSFNSLQKKERARIDALLKETSYKIQVAACTTREDFLVLFALYKIEEDVWRSSSSLRHAGYYGLYLAIAERFLDRGGWCVFLTLMGPRAKRPIDKDIVKLPYTEQIAACTTREDFLALFDLHRIAQDTWRSSDELRKVGYSGLSRAIAARFRDQGGWNSFLSLMGPRAKRPIDKDIVKLSYTKQIAACTTREDFLALFDLHKIAEDVWRSSRALRDAEHGGLCTAIAARFRDQGGWNSFLSLMGPRAKRPIDKDIVKLPYTKQIAACTTREDFLALFDLHKIAEDVWRSSSALCNAGWRGLYESIAERFHVQGGWQGFIDFMDNVGPGAKRAIDKDIVKLPYTKQIAACTTREDFLALFALHKITEDVWRSANVLINVGYRGLYRAIAERFHVQGGWQGFIDFMDNVGPGAKRAIDKDIVKLPYTEQIAACTTREDFLALFALHKITEDVWRSSEALRNAGNARLQAVITARFHDQGGWQGFLDFMDNKIYEVFHDELEKMGLAEAMALFGDDPLKLKFYLQYAHPELDEEERDRLVIISFKGLHGKSAATLEEYLRWDSTLPDVCIASQVQHETSERVVTISGNAPGADALYLWGSRTKHVRVQPDGTFTAIVPLKIGMENVIHFMSLNREQKQRNSPSDPLIIRQTEKPDDVAALIKLLSDLGSSLLNGIKKDPGRKTFLRQCAEQVLIKKFTGSFAEGQQYLEDLIAKTNMKLLKQILGGVLKKFLAIKAMRFPNVIDGKLMFFQKYCVHEIRRRMAAGEKGVNLANDPGLGKTRTILAALGDQEAAVFTPDQIVSTWDEEAGEVLENPDFLVLRNVPHKKRKELLHGAEQMRLVTNVQFLRKPDDAERFNLLSSENTVVVHDEAHSRANEQSKQSKGAAKLRHKFQINATATLAKNPRKLRRMLATLEPKDLRFKSDEAFAKAFPASDSKALKALKLLVDRYTIRFRKEDVMEEINPNELLSQQLNRLPRKEFVPPEVMGEFEMSEEQAWATYRLFMDWHAWTKHYDHYMPKDEVAEEDRLRVGGALVKRHALRQSVNSPAYIGSRDKDAKLATCKRIVSQCIREDRKVVIFCAYTSQALKYAEAFKGYQPALYIGLTAKQGEKHDAKGQTMKFKRQPGRHGFNGGWIFDANGFPIEDPNGETMSALDYERLTFQNAPGRKIIICTYNAGSVGTTFTAGKAMIDDDLPSDITEDIQEKDRIHRIDPHHQTHATVKYFKLRSRYPARFLDAVKKIWVVKNNEEKRYVEFSSSTEAKEYAESLLSDERDIVERDIKVKTAYETFFDQGTYDQVHSRNLEVQRQMFHLINDGIADESILDEDQIDFLGLQNGNGENGAETI